MIRVLCVLALCVAVSVAVPVTKAEPTRTHNSAPLAPKILIAVMTAPTHFSARNAIRSTWARDLLDGSNPSFDVRFFIGHPSSAAISSQIANEMNGNNNNNKEQNRTISTNQKPQNNNNGIVLLENLVESYQNLSRKTLGIVSWAKKNGYSRVLKIDDDTFVWVEKFEKFVESLGDTRNVYAGHFQDHGIVIDNANSKWNMRDQYDHDIFPPYAFGPCYFLGENLVNALATHSETLFPYRVEDAGVAIWANTLNLSPQREEMPNFLYLAECTRDIPKEGPVFVSPVNAGEMKIVWENAKGGEICGKRGEFVLEECRANRCRCWPPVEGGDCYSDFANGGYEDVIPRL